MATTNQARFLIAEVLNLDPMRVLNIDRELQKHRLRTLAKRGRGAEPIEAIEVASMLLGSAGRSPKVEDAVGDVTTSTLINRRPPDKRVELRKSTFGIDQIALAPDDDAGEVLARTPLDFLKSIGTDHSLRDAATALLKDAERGKLRIAIEQGFRFKIVREGKWAAYLEIEDENFRQIIIYGSTEHPTPSASGYRQDTVLTEIEFLKVGEAL